MSIGTLSTWTALCITGVAAAQAPLSTGFTYQGHFKQNGAAYTGPADLMFILWNDPDSQDPADHVGIQYSAVQITNGLFSVLLNGSDEFGPSPFNGPRWLEIQAAVPNDGSPYVTLTPRQAISAAPYALQLRGLAVDSEENVGVGTSYPNARLHIAANSSVNDVRLLTLAEDSADESFSFRGDFFGGGPSGNLLRLRSLWTDNVMAWRGDGRVGIGTSAPLNALHVAPSTGITIGVNDASGGHTALKFDLTAPSNGAGRIQAIKSAGATWGDIVMNVFGGNVGIGTATPTNKLTVNGHADVTGNFGIGTAAPGAPLHVASSGLEVARMVSTSIYGTWFNLHNTTAGSRYWRLLATGTGNGEGVGKLLVNTGPSPGLSEVTAMTFDPAGNVGVGTTSPTAKLDVNGTVKTKVLQITGGSDIAEPFNVSGTAAIEPGMVVAIDPSRPGELRLSDRAYDPTVAGIISGAGGVNTGLMLQQSGSIADGKHPVALTGRVWCYADADAGGAIQPGDLLTTSAAPGHAMKAADRTQAFGATIGKAMTALPEGKGLVLVLVTLQ